MIFRWLRFRWIAMRRHGVHSPFVFRYGAEILEKKPVLDFVENTPYGKQLLRALCYFRFDETCFAEDLKDLKKNISNLYLERFPAEYCQGKLFVCGKLPAEMEPNVSYCMLQGFKQNQQVKILPPNTFQLIHWDFSLLIYNSDFKISQTFFLK